MSFTFKRLSIHDVILVEPELFFDERGFFLELYEESLFIKNGVNAKFIQDNYSHSVKGVLRGLHYQKNPKTQAKLVTVIKGKIFDVAVDLRKNSPTFGKWVGEILSEENHNLLYLPEGFAHGFCVLSSEADVIYKINQEYSIEHERGIIWNDPKLDINWPLDTFIVSKKDLDLPLLDDIDNNMSFE